MSDSGVKPLPCPCCGSTKLYTGHTMATEVGIQCRGCGLTLSRSYPLLMPRSLRKKKGDPLEVLDAWLLEQATTAWNKRTKT